MTLCNSASRPLGWLSPVLLTAYISTTAFFASSAQASSGAVNHLPEPHRVVEAVTNRLLSIINDEKLDPVKNPDRFYVRANEILEPVVAFEYIAAGVMGAYLEKATPEQRLQFTEAFKKGLVSTYSKGVVGFSDSMNITTLQPDVDIAGQRKVSVVQEIFNGGKITYISCTMAQNRDKQWKLINVILNGVNLGKTFRGQFAQAVEKNQGDIAKVINNWGQDT